MKHVLLTGATGFLGSHLLKALLSRDYKISILKRSNSDTSRIDHLLRFVNSYDVDTGPIENAFKKDGVDAVVHTACSYGRTDEKIQELVETNVVFGLKVMEAALAYDTKLFINTDSLLPKTLNSYALTKCHFLDWLKHCSARIKVVNLKLEYMYGPKDDKTKFVQWLIERLELSENRIPLTSGEQKRDFIYVEDVVSAYLLILEKIDGFSNFSDFEVGTGETTSVRDFVLLIHKHYMLIRPNSKTELGFGDLDVRDGEPMLMKVDNRELLKLGWKIETPLQKGVEKMFEEMR